MNLPAIQRIAMEFERENDMMDQRQEMMDDAIDDTFEDEEEESDEIVNQVLDEIGVDLSQSVILALLTRTVTNSFSSSLGRPRKVCSINNLVPSNVSPKPSAPMTIFKLDSTV